jgi:hypothetical protein
MIVIQVNDFSENRWSIFICGSTALLLSLCRFFSFLIRYTVGRNPWMGDQPVTRPLPTRKTIHRITHTDIHVSSGIRNHDPNVRAGENGSCLRRRGHCDRPFQKAVILKFDCWLFGYYQSFKNVSETGLCLLPQLGPIRRASPYLWR